MVGWLLSSRYVNNWKGARAPVKSPAKAARLEIINSDGSFTAMHRHAARIVATSGCKKDRSWFKRSELIGEMRSLFAQFVAAAVSICSPQDRGLHRLAAVDPADACGTVDASAGT